MDGKQLKNSILQWAIQGKLVPQNPKDEPAQKLLERVEKERNAKIKSGEIKLTKPEKNIKKNFPECDIPQGWCWCQLVDICRAFGRIGFRGYTKEDLVTDSTQGALSISPSNMKDHGMEYNVCTYISWKKYEESPEIKIENGDLLIVKTGSSYGKAVLVENLPCKATINPQIAVIKDVCIEKKYLLYFLQSPFAREKYEDFVLGTSIPTFSQANLLSIGLALPPLAEQKRIVAKLEQVLPLAEEYGAAQEQLDKLNKELPEALKKSILQEAIQGKLVPQNPKDEPASVLLAKIQKEKEALVKQGKLKKKDLEITPIDDDEIPFEIPDSWTWCRLGDIVSKLVDGDHNPPSGIAKKTEYMMLSSRNINFDKLVDLDNVRYLDADVFAKENERTNATIGDVLFTSVGTIGRSCVLKEDVNVCFQRSVTIMTTYVYNEYLKRYFDSPFYQNYADEHAVGTAQRGFYLKEMEQSLIALPPLAEQKRIVAKLEQFFKVL